MKKKFSCIMLTVFTLITFFAPVVVNAESKSILDIPENLKDIIKQDEIDAKNGKEKLIGHIEVNEYDAIMNLKKKNIKALESEGLSPESIHEIENYDFHETLRELKSKSRSELKELGYSEERIDHIKAYDGSEASARAASAKFTAKIRLNRHEYISSEDITRFRIHYEWEWSDEPAMTHTDIIGACVSEGMYFEEDYSYHVVLLYNNVGKYIKGVNEKFRPTYVLHCAESTFKLTRNFPVEYALEGWAYCSFTKVGRVPEVSMTVKYGHTTWAVEPSISVGPGSFGFGFSPSWYVKPMGDDNYYIHSRNYGDKITIE